MKIDFEKEYSSTILKRSLEYYNYGCVKNIRIKDNSIGAIVEGTNNYHVDIEIKNGKVVDNFPNGTKLITNSNFYV